MPIQKEINLGTVAATTEFATSQEVTTGSVSTKAISPATLLKGQANGVATLDALGKIPVGQIPTSESAISLYDLFITSTRTSGNTFTDSSLSGRTITTSGGVVNSTAVAYSGKTSSILFTAPGDYLTVESASGLNVGSGQFVIGGRFRTTNAASDGAVFGVWGTTAATKSIAILVWPSNQLLLFVSDGTNENYVSTTININTWYKWEVVCDGVNYLLFLNDTQVGSRPVYAQGIATYASPLRIGRDSSRQFYGNIDTSYMKLGTTVRPTNQDLDDVLLSDTIPVFTGDSGAGGSEGLVPAPAIGDATKFLKGDGTWGLPSSNIAQRSVSGATTTDALTEADNGKMIFYNTTNPCTVIVPTSLPNGFNVTLLNEHASSLVTFVGAVGMTVSSKIGLKLQTGFASASLFVKSATQAYLYGTLQA